MSKSSKRSRKCTLIIHSIRIFDNTDSSYFATWTLGKESNSTEYRFPKEDGLIEFEKQYEIRVDSHQKLKQLKPLSFELFRSGKKPKSAGKVKMEIGPIIAEHGAIDQTLTMQSKNSTTTPPEIKISFYVNFPDNTMSELASLADDDLTSLADTTQDLSEFGSAGSLTRSLSKRTRSETSNPLADTPIFSSTQNLQSFQEPKLREPKQRSQHERRKTMASSSMRSLSNFLTSTSKAQTKTTFSDKQPDIAPVYDVIGDTLSNFDRLLAQTIDYTNKLCRSFEGPDSLIFAECLNDNLFGDLEESFFDSIMIKLPEKIIEAPILSTYNDHRRRFFPLYGLSALLSHPPSKFQVNMERTMKLFNAIQNKTNEYLNELIVCYVNIFEVQIKGIIEHKAVNEKTIEDFTRLFDAYLVACQSPKEFEKILLKAIVTAVDLMFMKKLLKRSNITFIDTLHWNSFCTCFNDNSSIDLIFFPQAVRALQMAQLIDQSHEEIQTICPNLSPQCVLQLLSIRKLDETLTQLPDIASFAQTYELDPNSRDFDSNTLVNWNEMLLESYKDVNTEQWTDINVPTQIRIDFPLIGNFFNEL